MMISKTLNTNEIKSAIKDAKRIFITPVGIDLWIQIRSKSEALRITTGPDRNWECQIDEKDLYIDTVDFEEKNFSW